MTSIETLEDILHKEFLKEESKYYGKGEDLKPINIKDSYDLTTYKRLYITPKAEKQAYDKLHGVLSYNLKLLWLWALYPVFVVSILALIDIWG